MVIFKRKMDKYLASLGLTESDLLDIHLIKERDEMINLELIGVKELLKTYEKEVSEMKDENLDVVAVRASLDQISGRIDLLEKSVTDYKKSNDARIEEESKKPSIAEVLGSISKSLGEREPFYPNGKKDSKK